MRTNRTAEAARYISTGQMWCSPLGLRIRMLTGRTAKAVRHIGVRTAKARRHIGVRTAKAVRYISVRTAEAVRDT